MSKVRLLETRIGGCWTGIKFHKNSQPDNNLSERPMRFCEAIGESRTSPIVLTPDLLDCPGGSRSLGWNEDDETIADMMARKANMDIRVARQIIRNTPRLQDKIAAVTVGTDDSPDVVLSYAQPEAAMNLLRQWQRVCGRDLGTRTSSFMAVCGNVAVKAYLTRHICLSFGCPDSREYGRISRDRLAVGIPFQLLETVLDEDCQLARASDSLGESAEAA